jgi:5,5'-dehydrodivanillate O-demethylase
MTSFKNSDLVHVAPGMPAGKFLRQFWQPLYRAEDIKPGWAKRVQIMNEFVTLYRGEDGVAHVVADRCPHRNTQLSIGWVEGDAIRCFYHGWKFDGAGKCLEMPCEADNFARKVAIRAYPTYEYLGLIFVYLGEGEVPAKPHFPELDEEDGILDIRRAPLPFNYFQRLENSLDEAHVHFVHKVSADLTDELRDLPQDFDAEETPYGILRLGIRERGDNQDNRYSHFFMPNCNLLVVPPANEDDIWAAHLTWRVPVTDALTMSYAVERRPADEPAKKARESKTDHQPVAEIVAAVLDGRMRMQDVDPNHPALFNIQDIVAMSGQGKIYSRENERLGQSDIGIILLRKIYQRELGKIRAGRPIKKWHRTADKVMLGFKPLAAE